MPPGVREATAADVPALAALINRAYRVEDFFVEGDRIDEAELGALWPRFLVLEEEGGRLGGCVLVEHDGRRGYLGLLSVDPELQGGGRGRRLVAAVEARCREAGCVALDLRVVDLREELFPFYRRLGFAEVGREPFSDPDKLKRPAGFVRLRKPLVAKMASMTSDDAQVHHHFKVFAGTLDAGGGLDTLAGEVRSWAAGGKVAPKSIGVEYVESAGKLLLSVGYRADEPGYAVRLESVALGRLDALDGPALEAIEQKMAAASEQQGRVICHELYVTGSQELRMVFMTREG